MAQLSYQRHFQQFLEIAKRVGYLSFITFFTFIFLDRWEQNQLNLDHMAFGLVLGEVVQILLHLKAKYNLINLF